MGVVLGDPPLERYPDRGRLGDCAHGEGKPLETAETWLGAALAPLIVSTKSQLRRPRAKDRIAFSATVPATTIEQSAWSAQGVQSVRNELTVHLENPTDHDGVHQIRIDPNGADRDFCVP